MSLLLDTQVVLWWLGDMELGADAVARIADKDTLVAVSAASVWEIEIKRSIGKLEAPHGISDAVTAAGFEPLAVDLAHAESAGALPLHHRDPFDRMLVAQAQIEGLTIVTRDPSFAAYDVATLTV